MKILFIYGTRPEAIKMAPLITELKLSPAFKVIICSTGQHSEMLKQVHDFFDITPDINLKVMKPNQSLSDLTSKILTDVDDVIATVDPDLVFVQGDTTSTFSGALASYYKRIKVAHLEAGLRSKNKYSPFPEEINRVLTTHLADYHFAPTEEAKEYLLKEGVNPKSIFLVGNTVIDALFYGLTKVENIINRDDIMRNKMSFIDFTKKVILVTGHRRESFGEPFKNICLAIKEIANNNSVEIVYPVHLNPNVREPVMTILRDYDNIHLIEPLNYPELIYIMNKSYFILTDSGGIQEEAPSLKKPVLVMREVTERKEGITAGVAKLIGTTKDSIVRHTTSLLVDKDEYNKMISGENPYGDGTSSVRIRRILENIAI